MILGRLLGHAIAGWHTLQAERAAWRGRRKRAAMAVVMRGWWRASIFQRYRAVRADLAGRLEKQCLQRLQRTVLNEWHDMVLDVRTHQE